MEIVLGTRPARRHFSAYCPLFGRYRPFAPKLSRFFLLVLFWKFYWVKHIEKDMNGKIQWLWIVWCLRRNFPLWDKWNIIVSYFKNQRIMRNQNEMTQMKNKHFLSYFCKFVKPKYVFLIANSCLEL